MQGIETYRSPSGTWGNLGVRKKIPRCRGLKQVSVNNGFDTQFDSKKKNSPMQGIETSKKMSPAMILIFCKKKNSPMQGIETSAYFVCRSLWVRIRKKKNSPMQGIETTSLLKYTACLTTRKKKNSPMQGIETLGSAFFHSWTQRSKKKNSPMQGIETRYICADVSTVKPGKKKNSPMQGIETMVTAILGTGF